MTRTLWRMAVRWAGLTALVVWSLGVGASSSRGDRIILRGGGELKGVIVPDPDQPETVLVQTETSSRPLRFREEQVVRVIREPGPLDEYLVKRDETAATAEAQYELGLWCEEQRLPGLAEVHFRQAIAHDESFGPAREKLGYIWLDGEWVTPDEAKQAQGLVRHRGRWVSPEERDRLEAEESLSAEQAAWARRIKILRQGLMAGPAERRQGAERQLLEIRDAAAVKPLVQLLGEDPEPIRGLLAEILGAIPGPEATLALIDRLLAETSPEVRQATMEALRPRSNHEVIARLVRALRAKDQQVVNRAAWALGQLDAVTAVPALVQALVARETRIIWLPQAPAPPGGGLGVTAMSVMPGNVGAGSLGAVPGAATPATPVMGFGGGPSIAMLTPPAVGPGSVAFGAVAVPFWDVAMMGVGGLPAPPSRTPPFQIVPIVHRNAEVLRALRRLTDQDFGFDQDRWRRWVRTEFRAEPEPVRRVPQP